MRVFEPSNLSDSYDFTGELAHDLFPPTHTPPLSPLASDKPGRVGLSPQARGSWFSRLLWRALALTSLALGVVGIVVPGLPTVCFVLLAAWCAGRGWTALETWLLDHPRFGPPIRHWRQYRTMPLRAKRLATASMLLSVLVLVSTAAPLILLCCVSGILLVVAIWMWRCT